MKTDIEIRSYLSKRKITMPLYNYNLSGEAELDSQGPFKSEQEAKSAVSAQDMIFNRSNLAQDQKDALLLKIAKDLSISLKLAPSDRVRLIKLRYDVITTAEDSYEDLLALMTDDYHYQYHSPLYRDRVCQELGKLGQLAMKLNDSLGRTDEWRPNLICWKRFLQRYYDSVSNIFLEADPIAENYLRNSQITDEESLVDNLQEYLVYHLAEMLPNLYLKNMNENKAVIKENWDWMMATWGPELPYRRLLA